MARNHQTIQTKYWQKARDRGLSFEEILVEVYLMTCPECGSSGIFKSAASTIGYAIGYPEGKIYPILRKLESKGRVFTAPGDWIFLKGKFEYENNRSSKIQIAAVCELESAPRPLVMRFLSQYRNLFTIEINTLLDTLSDTIPDNPSETVSDTLSDRSSPNNNNNNNNKTITKQKIAFGEKVKLSQDEYERLCADFTQNSVDKKIEAMNEYLGMHGKKPYADCNLALRNWFKKDGINPKSLNGGIKDTWKCTHCGHIYHEPIEKCYMANCDGEKVVKIDRVKPKESTL